MKIAYWGDFTQPWHTETHVARDMEALGHEVRRLKWESDLDWGVQQHSMVATSYGTDLLLLQGNGGMSVGGYGAHGWFRKIEENDCKTASYHLDLFVGLKRQDRVGVEAMWQTQTVFTADGDPNSQLFFASKGINHRWLPPAVVSDECEPGQWRDQYDYDVVFVGAANYHPEWPWRRTLIRALQKRYGNRFRLFDHHPPTRGRDLNDLYATARVVVGDSLCLPGHRNYFSDRYFETLGRGGFLIGPDVPGIEQFFVDGEHLRYYQSGDIPGLYDLVDYYLDHPDKANAIAARGQALVRNRHTYRTRIDQMLTEIGLVAHA